ncbi:MAG: hypothetical protein DI585_01260 [Pseudomonas fluorescens]|nr:MAG: hypothetical protein DI585_01260 [Pseudomonas fluorescens]
MQGTITLSKHFSDHKYYNTDVKAFEAMGFTFIKDKSYIRQDTQYITLIGGITLGFAEGEAEKVLQLIAFATGIGQGYTVEKCELTTEAATQAA